MYLTTHWIYLYYLYFLWKVFVLRNVLVMCWQGRKKGNDLFNSNTFHLRLYGIRHMVKDHLVREETCCRHIGYSFWLTARVLLYAPSHTQDSTYHSFITPVVDHWLEWEIAQWVHPMKDRSDNPSHHEWALLPWSYILLHADGDSSLSDQAFTIDCAVCVDEVRVTHAISSSSWCCVNYLISSFLLPDNKITCSPL